MKKIIFLIIVAHLFCSCSINSDRNKNINLTLSDTIDIEYLQKNMKKSHPRMILTNDDIISLKEKIKTDSLIRHTYLLIKKEAEAILNEDIIARNMEGKRLLYTSRKFLNRVNALSTVWLIEKDSVFLNRLNNELIAVSSFKDWNPEHFLDVAEILMGISLAIDWNYDDLPDSTIAIGKKAIIEKGLLPGLDTTKEYNWWHDAYHNWNQVCFGGMISGAIAIFEDNPELASQVINFSTPRMTISLNEYEPEGVYPEGASYWEYGSSYSVLTASILESAIGTDFGISNYAGFMSSPVFVLKSIAPSGLFFNFSDCGDYAGTSPYYLLSWFALKKGNANYLNKSVLIENNEKLPRYSLPILSWISKIEVKSSDEIPNNWKGESKNPLTFFSSEENDYYFACKGGSGSLNHANMDAGSFVFETDKIRWAIDQGNQNYTFLEAEKVDLWSKCQTCERWKLLTKNNFGHSTITINNKLHKVDAHSKIISYNDGNTPSVTIDLTPQFGSNIDKAIRTFKKQNNDALLIEDKFETNDSTETITWQMITTAQVNTKSGTAILSQNNKKLELTILSNPELIPKVISLYPPASKLDKEIENLKRIEIKFDAQMLKKEMVLIVKLKQLN
jgi:hypothetical protein